ncbi:hypothetical protein GGI07_001645 [Coemansia sp. Benny D115]|nr:hypothetical protein GGI07_001645 [Coemansia sp. Benny D115]
MDLQEPEEYCTCSALGGHRDDHTPTCLLYTPISAMDIPTRTNRGSVSSANGGSLYGRSGTASGGGSTRPPSYSGYGMGILSGSNMYSHYPQPSNASSVAASYASTSSMMDSTAATELDSLASYPYKRSMSVCSFSSTASSQQVLPTELLLEIFKYASKDDLKAVVQVSRQWRSAGNRLLWHTMVFPLDKRRLAAMKPALSHFGHLVRCVVITPPLLESQMNQGSSSRRMSISNTRSWSLSRPLSRSGSISLQHPQQLQQNLQNPQNPQNPQSHQQQQITQNATSLSGFNSPIFFPSAPSMASVPMSATGSTSTTSALASSSAASGIASQAVGTATAGLFGATHSDFASVASSPQSQPANSSHFPPPSPLSLAPVSRPRMASNGATPLPENSIFNSPSSNGGSLGRRQSRVNMASSPSPMLPPVYAVPIPGTPGPGNVLSESRPPSVAESSWGASGLGPLNMATAATAMGAMSGSLSSRTNNAPSIHSSSYTHHHHEVSEGTVLRMHQFMERFCPNVLEAVVKNPAGISSHSRRLGILTRLFQAYPRLEKLNLSDFIMWDPQPLQLVSDQLHMLSSLDVTNRVELSDVDLLPVVENCRRLREIRIRATNATDVTIYAIINNLSHSLVSLNVGGCPVSSAAMAELVSRCTKLHTLQMWSCLRLDDSFLQALDPAILIRMQVLDMMDVQKFSADVVRKTFGQQTWPYLRYLRIRAKCEPEDFAGIPPSAVLKLNSTTSLD